MTKRKPQPKRRTRPEFPSWIPAHLCFEEKELLVLRERDAVKKAERMVASARFRPREELLATPFEQRVQTIGVAEVAARAAAREDFRRQALAEIAEAEKAKSALPSHISRIARGSVKDFLEGTPIRPALKRPSGE